MRCPPYRGCRCYAPAFGLAVDIFFRFTLMSYAQFFHLQWQVSESTWVRQFTLDYPDNAVQPSIA